MILTANSDYIQPVIYTITFHMCRSVIHLLENQVCFHQMALQKKN